MAERDSHGNYMRSRLYQYQRDRKKFAFIVYGLATMFVALTAIQWVLMLVICGFRKFLFRYFFISLTSLLMALIIITFFVFFENSRFLFPLNWLISIVIVEFVTYGLSGVIVETSLDTFGISMGVVILLMIAFVAIGAVIPHDLTLDVVILFVCSIIFFIGSALYLMLFLISHMSYSLIVYAVFVMVIVLMFVMYHAQTINGGRYAEMRLSDYLLAALIIYHDFVILFMLCLFLVLVLLHKTQALPHFTLLDCKGYILNGTRTTEMPKI